MEPSRPSGNTVFRELFKEASPCPHIPDWGSRNLLRPEGARGGEAGSQHPGSASSPDRATAPSASGPVLGHMAHLPSTLAETLPPQEGRPAWQVTMSARWSGSPVCPSVGGGRLPASQEWYFPSKSLVSVPPVSSHLQSHAVSQASQGTDVSRGPARTPVRPVGCHDDPASLSTQEQVSSVAQPLPRRLLPPPAQTQGRLPPHTHHAHLGLLPWGQRPLEQHSCPHTASLTPKHHGHSQETTGSKRGAAGVAPEGSQTAEWGAGQRALGSPSWLTRPARSWLSIP